MAQQQKAKVRVRLDTTQAKAQLQGLVKEGEATAGRISDKMGKGSSIGGNFVRGGVFGAGAALGVGAAKVGAKFFGEGIAPVVGEATIGFRSRLDATLGGPEARAQAQARNETRDIFAASVGEKGKLTDATNYYNSVKQLRVREQKGASRIVVGLTDKGEDGAKAGGGGFIQGIIDPIIGAIQAGFDDLAKVVGG